MRSPFRHRVDRYALDVDRGHTVAGPLVRLACDRHLRDRHVAAKKSGHPLGLFFHEAAADHIIDFFEGVLRLPDTLDAEGAPVPFLLTPANTFIVGSIFGWKMPTGYRRFREAYVEEGKGNAKTPLAAGIGLTGGAAILAFLALCFGLSAAAAGLSTTMPVWAALLIVCGALVLIAAILAFVGIKLLQKGTKPLPEQALEEAELTAEALRNGE
jgi:uncharacterized membrane protein